MEKRTILAILLSVAVLFAFQVITARMYPVENKEDISKKAAIVMPAQPSLSTLPVSKIESTVNESLDAEQEYIEFENDEVKINFANPGAYIANINFKKYDETLFLGGLMAVSEDLNLDFKAQKESNGIVFAYRDADKEIVKRFILHNDSYIIELERNVDILKPAGASDSYNLFLASQIAKGSSYDNRFMELAISTPKKVIRKNPAGLKPEIIFSGDSSWVGLRDRYFTFIVKPYVKVFNVFAIKADGQSQAVAMSITSQKKDSLSQGTYSDRFVCYAGPQDAEKLAFANLNFDSMLYFGFFDTISQVLLAVLKFFFKFTRNWGLAIICFGVFIFLLLLPLSIKQMRSLKEMQILQPKIKELQAKYKGDAQRLNKEMMELYREHKVNPFGGCLPLLLQLPVFFALYQALLRFVGLRGAAFLWIKDLSKPDRLIPLSGKLPVIGDGINILPLLMMGSMFLQQKMSTGNMSGGASSEQQKMMSIMMPLMFGLIFYNMPSGLVLYWLVYGILSGVNQWRVSKKSK